MCMTAERRNANVATIADNGHGHKKKSSLMIHAGDHFAAS